MITIEKTNQPDTQVAKDYINSVFETIKKRNPHEVEFHQAVKEIFDSLVPIFAKQPKYIEHNILERLAEPEEFLVLEYLG